MQTLPDAVVSRFQDLLDRARKTDLREPTAMTLATIGSDRRISARIVLLRAFDERGFVFYTNLNSDKGLQLNANPSAALCFHWDALGEQVRIEGAVARVDDEEADAYWSGRERGSQIGAWASRQSDDLDSRESLEKRVAEMEGEFRGRDVPRPKFWSGFRVIAQRVEFWTNRPSRLHDRIVYELKDGEWATRLLFP